MVVDNYDMDTLVFAAELDFNSMFKSVGRTPNILLPKFPATDRIWPLSVILLYRQVCSSMLSGRSAVNCLKAPLYSTCIPEARCAGKKSVALSLRFRHPDRTLTDEEGDELFNRCLTALGERYGAVLRQIPAWMVK